MRYAILDNNRTITNIIEIDDVDIAVKFDAHYVGENKLGIGGQYPDTDLHPSTEMELLGQSITDEQLERIQLGQELTDMHLQLLALTNTSTGGTVGEDNTEKEA